MGNIAQLHWVAACGSHFLGLPLHCSTTVTKKASTLGVVLASLLVESVSLATTNTPALAVTPESGLVLEDPMMTPTRAETKLSGFQIMAKSTSKPLVISWCNKDKLIKLRAGKMANNIQVD